MGQVDYPLGIKYWAEHYVTGKPKMRVFKCTGKMSTIDAWIFESMTWPKTIMMKQWSELGTKDFKPFLIPLDYIRKTYGEEY